MDVVWCASKDHSCQTFNVNSIDLLKDKQMEKTLDKELLVHMAKNEKLDYCYVMWFKELTRFVNGSLSYQVEEQINALFVEWILKTSVVSL